MKLWHKNRKFSEVSDKIRWKFTENYLRGSDFAKYSRQILCELVPFWVRGHGSSRWCGQICRYRSSRSRNCQMMSDMCQIDICEKSANLRTWTGLFEGRRWVVGRGYLRCSSRDSVSYQYQSANNMRICVKSGNKALESAKKNANLWIYKPDFLASDGLVGGAGWAAGAGVAAGARTPPGGAGLSIYNESVMIRCRDCTIKNSYSTSSGRDHRCLSGSWGRCGCRWIFSEFSSNCSKK